MSHSLATADLIVLIGYFVLMMGVGVFFYRRSRDPDNYTSGGGILPGWLCGLSIFATFLSSISFLALPGKAFAGNWNPFVFSLSLPITAWIAARWFVPLYRRTGHVSAYEYLEQRFGPWARNYAGVCFVLLQLMRIGSVLYLLALPLSVLLGWPIGLVILVTGISTMIYSMLGGLVAVIWSDAIQAVVLIAGALLCLGLMLAGMPGGPGQMFEVAVEHHKFSLGEYGLALDRPTFWVVLVYGFFINLQNFGVDQGYIQRYVASKSARAARRAVWLGGLLYVPVSAVFFFIGTALFVYYQQSSAPLPESLSSGQAPDMVFPYFIVSALPAGMRGLLIAAIFAAGMSTISTSLNSSATLLTTDLYQRYLRPRAGEQERLRVLYAGTVLWGVLGTGVALAMIGVKHALDAWWELASVFSGGMLGLFLLGILARRVGNRPAMAGVGAGVLAIAWMVITPRLGDSLAAWRSPLHGFLTIVTGTLTIFFVGNLVSLLAQGDKPSNGTGARSS